ncbi:hemojuvelin [Astyanax mexicanus]|uniref:Hemojuvelin n=1 Tax=Astyanax mexicanus TaxID=7994 RepID=A0A8B9I0S8_ASTMX|nr:hemojuvelin [Astyanax mexicanus]
MRTGEEQNQCVGGYEGFQTGVTERTVHHYQSSSQHSTPPLHCKELQQPAEAVCVWTVMGERATCTNHTKTTWRCHGFIVLLLVLLTAPQAWGQCRILRCNSEFVATTLELGGGGGVSGKEAGNAGYCSALRSYALCTRHTARACRGDLAYHSAVQGIEDLLIQHRCPRTGPTAQPRPLPQAPISLDACFYERGYVQREGRAPEYLHCGVFGDPHVRTFNDEFQTCAVPGAWPLIDNQYLYIQATSTPTRGGSYATAITKITIIFKNWRECSEQQLYQAELDNVPPAFTDGSTSSRERRGQHSLRVRSQAPGRHAEIWAAHIGTTLVVRQSGRTLGLSVRSPRPIVKSYTPEQDVQLCVWGCPASQRLETPHALPTAAAHAHCSSLLPTQDVYFQACLFDLLATGDTNSSSSAFDALEDARALIVDPQKVHLLVAAGVSVRVTPQLPALLAGTLITLWLAL